MLSLPIAFMSKFSDSGYFFDLYFKQPYTGAAYFANGTAGYLHYLHLLEPSSSRAEFPMAARRFLACYMANRISLASANLA